MFEKIVIVDAIGWRPRAIQGLRKFARQVDAYGNIPENREVLVKRIGKCFIYRSGFRTLCSMHGTALPECVGKWLSLHGN